MKRNMLCVGVDDTNHANNNQRGDLFSATFSLEQKDIIPEERKNRRYSCEVINWVDRNDYRFTQLIDDRLRRFKPLTPFFSCFLISSYLKDLKISPENIEIRIDGEIERYQEAWIKDYFRTFDCNVNVKNLVKPNKGRMSCSTVLYAADILSRYINRKLERVNFQGELGREKINELGDWFINRGLADKFVPLTDEFKSKLAEKIYS